MRTGLAVLAALVVAGCAAVKPVPISTSDTCFRCRQPIADTKLAAEIIDANYRAYKFKTVSCLATYLNEHPERLRAIYVTNSRSGRLISAESAAFVEVVINRNTLQRDYVAFGSLDEASQFARENQTVAVGWDDVLRAKAAPAVAG